MLRNYLKTAFRSILKKRLYSFINVMGLAIGIACSLLIIIYIHFELSFDRFHLKYDQIYRVNTLFSTGDLSMTTNQTPAPVLGALQSEFPEVETGTRVYKSFRPVIVGNAENLFEEKDFFYADSSFFSVFSYTLRWGNSSTALTKPNSVVLSERSAIKYFGRTDVLNEGLTIDGHTYVITGVANDPPGHSHLNFDFMASFTSLSWAVQSERWGAANFFTYLVINQSADIENTNIKLQEMVVREMGPFDGSLYVEMNLVPLKDIHLRSRVSDELHKGDITYVYIFSFIAVLIIVIACVNYMNLSTARAVQRAKEVGMRKVLGAYRPQLFFQFISESALITATSIVLGIVIAVSSISFFAEIAGRPLDNSLLENPAFYLGITVLWVVVSFLAGTYPALVLSSYAPGKVLRASFKDSGSGAALRKILVIFQFTVSVFLFIGSLVIFRQLDYMQTKNLGYDKERLIILPADQTVRESFNSFKTEIRRIPEVQNAALANESLSQVRGGYSIKIEGIAEDEGILTTAMVISPDFIETTGISLLAGENFTQTDLIQSGLEENPVQNVLVNEELTKLIYLTPEEAVGKKTDLNGRYGIIKGVLKNFHFRSLREKIQPIVFFIEPKYFSQMVVRAQTSDPRRTVNDLKAVWESTFNHRPFEFTFLDQQYNSLYKAEEQLKDVYTLFTGLAIFIGCLGLFGLVSFTTVQRSKEIGIRKILGATVRSIIALISFDFLKLVFLGFIVAVPLAYWLMDQWLMGFEYRIPFSWEVVAVTLAVQVLLALVVTSYQSIRAALANPVESIRNE